MSFKLSHAQRAWRQAVSPQSQPHPRGCSHQWEGDHQSWCAGLRGSQLGAPAWLLPIRVSGHGWRFINSVLLLKFLFCANLLLSDHFQQIYLDSHVKLQQTPTN